MAAPTQNDLLAQAEKLGAMAADIATTKRGFDDMRDTMNKSNDSIVRLEKSVDKLTEIVKRLVEDNDGVKKSVDKLDVEIKQELVHLKEDLQRRKGVAGFIEVLVKAWPVVIAVLGMSGYIVYISMTGDVPLPSKP
jgi:septal ring factor EnvC (AmiA/AmiB activator)